MIYLTRRVKERPVGFLVGLSVFRDDLRRILLSREVQTYGYAWYLSKQPPIEYEIIEEWLDNLELSLSTILVPPKDSDVVTENDLWKTMEFGKKYRITVEEIR